jgi:hypothetical protein
MRITPMALALASIPDDGAPGGSAGEALRIEYRRIQAITSRGNQRVRIDADGSVYADVVTRDCPSGEHWAGPWPTEAVRTLSAADMERLRREVLSSGFLDLPAQIERPGRDGYRDELDVSVGGRSHSVAVERADAPPAFIRLRQAVLAAAGLR